MPLSRKDHQKVNADPARRAAGEKSAWTRTKNERRIDSLFRENQELRAYITELEDEVKHMYTEVGMSYAEAAAKLAGRDWAHE